jgi:hypothetical protein
MRDKHAKLRAPVPNVVHAQRVVPDVLKRARKTLSNDRGSQVANMHLCCQVNAERKQGVRPTFGDVGRGVVDEHALGCGEGRQASKLDDLHMVYANS